MSELLKLTKMESADYIIEHKGDCMDLDCLTCCLNGEYDCFNCENKEEMLAMAIKYKKEHK